MRKKLLVVISLCLLIFAAGCGSKASESVSTEEMSVTANEEETKAVEKQVNNVQTGISALKVKGTKLVDASDESPVQLKGISTHGLSWFPDYVNEQGFKDLKELFGINTIRLAMYSDENMGYCSGGDKEKLKNLVRQGVEFATKAEMYVIVDWHVLGDQNPLVHKDEAKAFFEEMVTEFKDKTNVIYEICNEPNGSCQWEDVKNYANEVIPVIRGIDEDAVIIVGTTTWSQDIDKAAQNPITGFDNIMYALHFYSATHKDDLRNKIDIAEQAGIPVFVSEFGICDASGNGALDTTEADKWLDKLDSMNISYVVWNLSNKAEASALLKVECSKLNGYTADDLSECGNYILHRFSGK